jgi:oligopeptide/dipeptide ABC transporter ATP-binding protein
MNKPVPDTEGSLLEARDVSVSFPGRQEPAVEHANLVVEPGAAIGIVGESGSGKTTMARALAGALLPTGGEVLVRGKRWADVARTDQRRRAVQMIFQDPYGSLNPWKTVLRTVTDVVRQWNDVDRRTAAGMAEALLSEVGLPGDVMKRRPGRLSGGQCQRVGIARALACEPSVILADEPTSSLDVSIQAQVLGLIGQIREQRAAALLLVSHDLLVVEQMTSEALVMYHGRVVERGPTSELLNRPMHPYTRILVDSIPGREGSAQFAANVDGAHAAGCPFRSRCPRAVGVCAEVDPPLAPMAGSREVACHRPIDPA